MVAAAFLGLLTARHSGAIRQSHDDVAPTAPPNAPLDFADPNATASLQFFRKDASHVESKRKAASAITWQVQSW
jgi:hypothetical protein